MVRREALAILNARYAFIETAKDVARLNALRESGDFEDSRGAVYAEAAARPPDYLPLRFMDVDPLLFEETPADLMRPQDWKDVLAVRVGYDADIMQLEGEALVLAYKHILAMPRAAPGRAKERARAQRETRAAAAQRLTAERGALGSLTVLEQIAIRPVTEALYKKTAAAFLEFCTKRGLDWHNVEEMDVILAQYMDDCFHRGASPDHGTQLLASLAHLYPSLRGQWKLQWPRAARASISWKRRVPAGTRLPLPKAVAMAVCLLLVEVSDHLHCLRHGGASDDLLSRRRGAFQVQVRGRWASVKSLKRYGKETKLLSEISSVHGDAFRLGHLMLEHFWTVVMAGGTLEASISHLIPATCVPAVRAAR
ncbi:unnamed protein product, partial [Prorocentrum cordatum]